MRSFLSQFSFVGIGTLLISGCGSINGGVTSPDLLLATITSHPNILTASTNANFTFTAAVNGINTFQCQLDGGAFGSCSNPKSYTGLSVGAHTFNVKYSSNGNSSNVATFSWSVATCAGGYTPFTTQLGGGLVTTSSSVVHNACNSIVAGTNLVSGSNYISGATESGTGGVGATSVVIAQYNFVGELNWSNEYSITNGVANVSGLVQDGVGNLYAGGFVMCNPGQTCNFGGTVQGASGLGLNGNSDAFIMKFNSSGVLQWVRQLGGGAAAANTLSITAYSLAVDAANNIYIAGGTANTLGGVQTNGHSTNDAYVAKYSSAGAFAWVSEMGNGAGASYIAYGVTIDSGGNVDVSGNAQGALLNNQLTAQAHGWNDVFVMRLNAATGAHTWDYQLGNAGNMWGNALQTDSSNNLYVAGYTDGLLTLAPISGTLYGTHGVKDVFVVKFSNAGGFVSATQFGALGASMTLGMQGGNSISEDTAGNFYIMGQADSNLGGGCYNSCSGPSDAFVIKVSSALAYPWVSQFGSTGNAGSNYFGITSDSSGNSYLASMTSASLGLQYGTHAVDSLVTSISAAGVVDLNTSTPVANPNPLWPIQLGAFGQNSQANGVTQDSSGNFYMAGFTTGNLGGTQYGTHGGQDAVLAKYDSLGNQIWKDQLGAAGTTTTGMGAFQDSTGTYVVGKTSGVLGTQYGVHGSSDLFVAKFLANGAMVSTSQYGKAGATLSGNAMVMDSSGNFYATGSTDAYLGGIQTGTLGNTDALFMKINSLGVFQFANQIGAVGEATQANAMVMDGANNFYIAGTTSGNLGGTIFGAHGNSDLFVAKYTSAGAFVWVVQYGSAGKITVGTGITMDSTGNNVVVVGDTNANLAGSTTNVYHGSNDLVVVSFAASNGAKNWAEQLGASFPCYGGESCNGFQNGSVYGQGIARDASGNYFVTGYANGGLGAEVPGANIYRSHGLTDAIVAQFASNGTYNWTSQMSLSGGNTYGMAIFPSTVSGRAAIMAGYTDSYLGGTQYGVHGNNDLLLFGVSSSGVMP